MKRITTTILYLLSVCWLILAASLPAAAQTDTYIHFAGHGQYVLNVDNTGKLSAYKQTDATAAPSGGMSWTLTGDDTDGYTVKATVESTTFYLYYNSTDDIFETTTDETSATKFTKNTYASGDCFHKGGGDQYSLTIKDNTLTDGKTALGMENGQIVRAIPNSRYGNLRFPATITGTDFPKTADEDAAALYNILFTSSNKYAYTEGVGENILATEGEAFKNQSKYKWQFVKANDEGAVYIYNPASNSYMKTCTSGQQPYKMVATQKEATLFRLIICYDASDRNSVFVIYDNTSRAWMYMNYYTAGQGHNAGAVDYVSNEAISHTDSKIQIIENNETTSNYIENSYLHFAGQGKNALYDNGDGTANGAEPADGTAAPTGGFSWTISLTDNGYIVKSVLGNYLKYEDGTGFATVTEASQATYFDVESNTYYPTGETRYSLVLKGKTLADGTTKAALGMKNGQLCLAPYNSRYDCLRLAKNVVGTGFPKTSDEDADQWYTIQFKKDNTYIKGVETGQNLQRVGNTQKDFRECKWQFIEADNQGHFYIKNFWGGYIKAGNGVNDSYTLVANETEATSFILTPFNDNATYRTSLSLYEVNSGKGNNSYINHRASGMASWSMDNGGELYIIENNTINLGFTLDTDHYLHFAGQGKNALYNDNGTVTTKEQKSTETASSDAEGFAWRISQDGNSIQSFLVQNGNTGNYLKYDAATSSFTIASGSTDATRFEVMTNTFYPTGETRYSLVLKDQTLADGTTKAALGMKEGQLCLAPYNSRYACLRIKDNVTGPDFPLTTAEAPGKWYNIQFPNAGIYVYAAGQGENLFTSSDNKDFATQNKWRFIEGNESGEVYIESFMGGYMKAASDNDGAYTLTENKGDATLFRFGVLNDNANNNTVFFLYHYQSAGDCFANYHQTFQIIKNHSIPHEDCRIAFIENSEARTFTHKYLQLSGLGNMILFDNAEGGLEIHRIMGASIHEKGYFWENQMVEGQEGKQFRMLSEEGNYIMYDATDGTFKTTPDKEEATRFDRTLNTYMLNKEIRYNLNVSDLTGTQRALGLEQGEDGERHITLTETNSRMACIRITDNIPSREFPKLSSGTLYTDEEESTWYSIRFKKDNYYLFKTDNKIYCQQNPTDITGPLFKWRFLRAKDADGIYRGDVYIQNQSGYFMKLEGGKYVLTSETDADANGIPADATPLRITCYNDDTNATTNSGWHIRTKGMTGSDYMQNTNGVPGNGGGPNENSSAEITLNNIEYFRFMVFPAAGSLTLCDGLSREDNTQTKPHAHRMETGEVNLDHLRWNLKMNKDQQVTLKNKAGYYLTWNDTDGFGISTEEADAYPFGRQRNYYENNQRLRYELMKNDGSNQALIIKDLETGELGWGQPGTRFSCIYTFELVAGPALPKASVSGSDFQLYRLRFQEGNHYCITDTGTDGATLSLEAQNDKINQLWTFVPHYPVAGDPTSFIGDYYLQNVYGRYLALNKNNIAISQNDSTGAVVVRPIETNSHYYSWQLQVVGRGGNNILNQVGGGGGTTLGLWSPNDNGNFFRLLPEDIYPEFYEELGGSWRNIRFSETEGMPYMQADENGNVVGRPATTNDEPVQWKNIGSEKDFVLRNGNNQFIAYGEDGKLYLTENIEEAKHFYLWMNNATGNVAHWTVCELPEDGIVPEIPEKVMQLNTSDNYIYMVNYTDGILSEATTSQEWTSNATPIFSNDDNSIYYFIRMTKGEDAYLSDGLDGKHDALAETKQKRNGMIWKLDGLKNRLRLVSRNGEYLVWNPTGDGTFGVSTNPDSAAIFKFHTTAAIGEDDTDETQCYFELTGGTNVTDSDKGKFIARGLDGSLRNHAILADDAEKAYVMAEQLKYLEAGDYKNFRILPKRSWFLYQTMNSPYEPITGFLPKQDRDYGWTVNEYTGEKMQATNTFRITHYMKQGTARNLILPTILEGFSWEEFEHTHLRAYQRWYDYKTGGLIPDNRIRFIDVNQVKTAGVSGNVNNIVNSRRDYANGTIMGNSLPLNYLYGGYIHEMVKFEMPEITDKDYTYVVGLDASLYTDFVDYFGDNNNPVYSGILSNEIVLPDRQNFIEPTIGQRCIYEIRDARQMADKLSECTYDATKENSKWQEERTITFPRRKMGFRHSTVPLNLQLQDYWYYKDGIADADHLQNITGYDHIYFTATSYKDGKEMTGNKQIGGFDINEWPVEGTSGSNADLSRQRFVRFIYPKADGSGNYCGSDDMGYFEGDSCIIRVYARDGGTAGQATGYKALYQLARIKLLFEDNIEPRIYSEIMGIDETGEYKSFRAPDYMRTHYGGVKASIDFDDPDFVAYQAPLSGKNMVYQNESTNGAAGLTEPNTYGYPLLFENSGYNYQPSAGTTSNNTKNTWGSYTINKQLIFDAQSNTRPIARPVISLYKDIYSSYLEDVSNIDDSYAAFLYVDASEMPGEICSLDYTGQLCTGARLYFSGWITSNDYGETSYPANVILTVYGVTDDGNKEALHTYCPGPILAQARDINGNRINPENGKNALWQQMYFSFVNRSNKRFEKYTLTIDNACTNSRGGDILIDDVNIYAQEPYFNMEKTLPLCGQQLTVAKMTSDFDALTGALGITELKGENVLPNREMPRLWYCFLDKEVYDQKLTELVAGKKDTLTTDLEQAFDAAVVGSKTSTSRTERAFRYAVLNSNYSLIPDFTYEGALTDVIDDKDPSATGYIRKEVRDGKRNIVISDRLSAANLKPGHDYMMAFVPLASGRTITQNSAASDFQWASSCRIKIDFHSENAVHFVSNGESGEDDRTLTACAGQTIGISPQMKGLDLTYKDMDYGSPARQFPYPMTVEAMPTDSLTTDSLQAINSLQPMANEIILPEEPEKKDESLVYKIEQYDWWMDFMGVSLAEAFIAADGSFVRHEDQTAGTGEVSVREALDNFRHFFPKANSPLDADVKPRSEDGYVLTQTMIKGLTTLEYKGASIQASVEDVSGNAKKFHPLIFNNSTLNLNLPEDMIEGKEVTVTTIPIIFSTENVIFCFDPQQVRVKITGNAPSMTDGFDLKDDSYPKEKVNIPVRTSLTFLKKVTASADDITAYTGNSMRIPLRKIKTVNSNATGLQPLVREGDAHAYIYISGSNDPDMKVYEGEDEVTYRRIGVVKEMAAPVVTEANATSHNAYAELYFLPDFTPREGYTYTLRLEYGEQFAEGDSGEQTTCDGAMSVDLLIVPRYVVWTGNAGNNDWNNDDNWMRADHTDLNLTGSDGYVSNEANGTWHAFAPLDHTNVIIPDTNLPPVLYNNGYKTFTEHNNQTHDLLQLNETATPNMEWDLATSEKQNTTHCLPHYNHNICDMVLKSGAELLRSDYLTYGKAWMEYTLQPDRWYTLGTPIQGVYAGDWYTDTEGGHDYSPYFKDQTFDDKDEDKDNVFRHHRFAPAIYQKSWDKGEAMLFYLDDSKNEKSTDVMVAANWSKVYNDVDVPYGNNGGFSVKANSQGVKRDGTAVTYTDFLIRIPKEDSSFYIYTQTGNHLDGGNIPEPKGVDRTLSHKLYSDLMKDKNGNSNESFKQTLTNATEKNNYFLVSNPFTCGLDMGKFMDANSGIEHKYWMLTADGQTASIKDETSPVSQWITVNGSDTESTNGVLAPGQGFFVKRIVPENTTPADGKLTLTFNAGMMTQAHTANVQLRTRGVNRPGSRRSTLRIRAVRGSETSEAVVVKDTAATNAFDEREDLETIRHNTLSSVPTVYTIAGKQAAAINRRKSMYRVPLGIGSNSEALTRLTFTGMKDFDETLSLLDNLTGETIPLTLAGEEQVTVDVEGNTSGRYFIISSEKPSQEDELTDMKPIIEVKDNRVGISANASHLLTYIHIVDAEGRTIYAMTPYQPYISLKLPVGIYVVEARTESQSTTMKVTIN